MRGISLAVAVLLVVAVALASYAIAYFGKPAPQERAEPPEAVSFSISSCSAGTGTLALNNDGNATIPAGVARLYDSGSTLISENVTIPQVPPGEASTITVQGLVAGMGYYLEYPGTAPRLFSCAP